MAIHPVQGRQGETMQQRAGARGGPPADGGSVKKRKKLRWAHVTSAEVNSALSGLLENTIVVLPESCVSASGIQPNMNDKNKSKKLVPAFPAPPRPAPCPPLL